MASAEKPGDMTFICLCKYVLSQMKNSEFHTAQLRDVSRTGVYFHSNVEIKQGAGMELTFALPGEKGRGTSVLIRATAKRSA